MDVETTRVEAVLRQHGLSGHGLLLLRRAADDAPRRHGAFLDDERRQELVSFMLRFENERKSACLRNAVVSETVDGSRARPRGPGRLRG